MEKKRGAPVKPDDQRRSIIVPIRLSPVEKQAIDAAAGDATLSDWAREVLLRAAKRRTKAS